MISTPARVPHHQAEPDNSISQAMQYDDHYDLALQGKRAELVPCQMLQNRISIDTHRCEMVSAAFWITIASRFKAARAAVERSSRPSSIKCDQSDSTLVREAQSSTRRPVCVEPPSLHGLCQRPRQQKAHTRLLTSYSHHCCREKTKGSGQEQVRKMRHRPRQRRITIGVAKVHSAECRNRSPSALPTAKLLETARQCRCAGLAIVQKRPGLLSFNFDIQI